MDDRYPDSEPRVRAGAIRLRISGDKVELADQVPSFQLGPYELRRPLVIGRVGVVFEALGDPDDGFSVAAVHVPLANFQDDPVFVDRYLARAARCRGLTHPALVETWEAGENGLIWRAMEQAAGATIQELVGQRRPPLAVTLRILKQVAGALKYLHSRNLVHGRLSGARIKLQSDGEIKICGHATVEPEDLVFEPAEMAWRAPEQLGGDASICSDVYQLGLLGLILLNGQNPFQRVTIPQTRRAVEEEIPALVQGLPAGLSEVLEAALEKRPTARPSIAEVIARLERVDVAGPRGWPIPESLPEPVPVGEVEALRQRLADGRSARRLPPAPPPPLLLPGLMSFPAMMSGPLPEIKPLPELDIPASEHSLLPMDEEVTEPLGVAANTSDVPQQSPAMMLLWGLALGVLGGLVTAAVVAGFAALGWWLINR